MPMSRMQSRSQPLKLEVHQPCGLVMGAYGHDIGWKSAILIIILRAPRVIINNPIGTKRYITFPGKIRSELSEGVRESMIRADGWLHKTVGRFPGYNQRHVSWGSGQPLPRFVISHPYPPYLHLTLRQTAMSSTHEEYWRGTKDGFRG